MYFWQVREKVENVEELPVRTTSDSSSVSFSASVSVDCAVIACVCEIIHEAYN